MRDETLVELRLKHPIGQHPFVRHVEIRLRFVVRHVDVLRIGWTAERELVVEAVHPAVGSRKLSRSVARCKHGLRGVIYFVLFRKRYRLQLDRVPLRILAAETVSACGYP